MRLSKHCVPIALTLLPAGGITAQQRYTEMSLEELFRLADSNSRSVKIHSLKAKAARESVAAARGERLPQVDAGLSFSYLGDGRVWNRDFSDGMKADIPHYGNNFVLTASQTIYSGGAVSSGIKMAEIAERMAGKEETMSRNDARLMAAGYYLEMYKTDNRIRVYDRNIALTEDLIASVKARYEQGTALEDDITRYELQLADCRLARTKLENSRHLLNYRLNRLVGLADCTVITISDTARLALYPDVPQAEVWQRTAATESPSVALSELGVMQSEQQERMVRSESLPKVALFAEEHLDGPVTIEVPALDKNFNYWFVGVGVKFNISSLYKNRSRINRARMETLQHREELSLLRDDLACAVEDACTAYREALHEKATLEKNVELARQNYRTMSKRYDNGLALATDMLEVSNALLDAELRLANAHASVLFAYYKLRHTAGNI